MRGDPGGAVDLREVVKAGLATGDLVAAEGALYSLGFYENDNEVSLARYDEAIAFGSAHGLSAIGERVGRVGTLFAAGRWDDVLEEGTALRTSADLRGDTAAVWIVHLYISMIQIERGENIGRQDELLAGARDHGFPMIYVAPVAAEAALADGEAEIARQLLTRALDETARGEVDYIAHFVRVALKGHAPELARRALALGTPPNLMNDSETQLAEAMLAEVDGDLPAARHGYERAETMLGEIHWVPLRAYALTGLARCLIAFEEVRAGILKLEEARDLWESVDVKPRIVEIDQLLAAMIPHLDGDPA